MSVCVEARAAGATWRSCSASPGCRSRSSRTSRSRWSPSRLCDVAPDGASLLVTRGLLNLAQRHSRVRARAARAGAAGARHASTLDAIGHRFGDGRRLRVGFSPTYWPLAWPSPRAATLRISDVVLELPLRDAHRRGGRSRSGRRSSRRSWRPRPLTAGTGVAAHRARPGDRARRRWRSTGTWAAASAGRATAGSSARTPRPRATRSSRATRCRPASWSRTRRPSAATTGR